MIILSLVYFFFLRERLLVIYFYVYLLYIYMFFFKNNGDQIRGVLGFDLFSWVLILLTFFLVIYILIVRLTYVENFLEVAKLYLYLLVLIMGLIYCFYFQNYFLFYVSFELSVVPIFLIIVGWGYSINRLQAGLYMFLYTLFTSLPFLILLIKFYLVRGSLNYYYVFSLRVLNIRKWWWVFFLLVFIVKLPIYLLHLWLPKAHVEAPLMGSIMLAGVLLKLGGYGVFKGLLFFFNSLFFIRVLGVSIALVGSIWVSFMCLRQIDIKRLIAYSSVVHIGPVLFCLLVGNYISTLGGVFIILRHGVCSSGLFYILNLRYDRLGSRRLLIIRGSMVLCPIISFFWFFLVISNIGCPPTFNFFSEIFIILRCVFLDYSFIVVFILVLFFSGVYCIYLYVFFNHGDKLANLINFSKNSLIDYSVALNHRIPLFLFIFFMLSLF